ncbi:MAG: hypothetical protein M1828_003707 [Chrysothrix sp. TS-e1954]|nr:MAG: hypothetical protein M1828_003707 [Chrysothrix sp. TS-e1954]
MPTEQTPLIQVVTVAPPRERYSHQAIRKVCTLFLGGACILVGLLFLIPIAFPDFQFPGEKDFRSFLRPTEAWPQSQGISYEELQNIVQKVPSAKKVRESSKYYTSGPHLAGTNLSQALWTKGRWQEAGILDTQIVAYDVYLNYPRDHRLALLEEKHGEQHVRYEASLEEDVIEEDPTTNLTNRVPTFHGYSATGNVTAQYVYVNYGTYQDFEDLVNANVSLAGKIALAKYGGVFRGLKVKRAQELGMIGTIIYSDPGDDGDMTDENGKTQYPNGPAREASSVQRGSAQYLSIAPGDPTTPGYPSKPGVIRQPVDGAIPAIPSIPISYTDALPLLKALNGHGPSAADFNKYWHTGGLRYKGVEYNIGPSPPELTLNLFSDQEYVTTPMWDVIGIINGTLTDEAVILGNHRDAWIAGGAADPNSGSSALNEVARGFGAAMAAGWKPLRTIVLASWDGEEYGLIGSTEWVEEYLPWLSKSAVAYLNVDVATAGPNFGVAAAPLLNKAVIEIVNQIHSPNQTKEGQSVGDTWNKHIATIGSGSDFTAFQDYAGVPCVDLGFRPGGDSPVYHYHSNYDSFYWMENFGDPGWHYHVTMAKIWSSLAVKLIDSPIIQFNATDYAKALSSYVDKVKEQAATASHLKPKPTFSKLESSVAKLHSASQELDARATQAEKDIAHFSELPLYKRRWMAYRVARINHSYKYLERHFLYPDGLDSRSWFKHSVFAPGLWTGYAGATFPGIVESIDAGNRTNVHRWEDIITDQVKKIITSLA